MYKLIMFLAVLFIGTSMVIENTNDNFSKTLVGPTQPEELGDVIWMRDIDMATKRAAKEDKPIFLLFQEVPGCSTCRNYGHNVLSHPLIVEAIETHFVPLAIFNNKGGKDKEVLDFFKEPTWNNPVVRIVDAEKKNLINRISGNYSTHGVTEAMIQVMNAHNIEVPNYLSLLQKELTAQQKGLETTYLSMFCFWTGEKEIAQIDGVISTQAGFMDGHEVVEVQFDPNALGYKDLVEKAEQKSCASKVYTDNSSQQQTASKLLGASKASSKKSFRIDPETKYYLYKSNYKYIPMTALQATQVNSLIGKNKSPNSVLSNRQIELYKYIKSHPNKKWKSAINEDLILAWEKVTEIWERV